MHSVKDNKNQTINNNKKKGREAVTLQRRTAKVYQHMKKMKYWLVDMYNFIRKLY